MHGPGSSASITMSKRLHPMPRLMVSCGFWLCFTLSLFRLIVIPDPQ